MYNACVDWEIKERALLCVPTRGQVWHGTAAALLDLRMDATAAGERLPISFCRSKTSVVEARNLCFQRFLQGDWKVLLMVDDDVVPSVDVLNFIDIVLAGEADIVSSVCPVIRPGLPVVPNLYEVLPTSQLGIPIQRIVSEHGLQRFDAVGFGVVAMHRKVVQKLKVCRQRTDRNGVVTMGEDVDFCARARAEGFKVACDLDVVSDHMMTVSGNHLLDAYRQEGESQ